MQHQEAGFIEMDPSWYPDIEPEERRKNLAKVVYELRDLPVFSPVGLQLIRELTQGEASIKKLVDIISNDQVVAAKIVRQANSAYFGIRNQIRTVRHAVAMLGADAIRDIAFNFCFQSLTRQVADAESAFYERYFTRCLTTATLSRKICAQYGFPSVGTGEAYLAGLLQNIGILLLFLSRQQQYLRALEIRKNENIPLFVAEERIFGCNHADAGNWLAEKWNLPENLQEVIRVHNRPAPNVINKELLAIVQLAGEVCNRMEVTLADGKAPSCLDPLTVQTLQTKYPNTPAEEIAGEAVRKLGHIALSGSQLFRSLEGRTAPEEDQPEQQPATAAVVEAKPQEEAAPEPQPDPAPEAPRKRIARPSIQRSWSDWVCGLAHIRHGQIGRGLLLILLFCTAFILGSALVPVSPLLSIASYLCAGLVWSFSCAEVMDLQKNREQ